MVDETEVLEPSPDTENQTDVEETLSSSVDSETEADLLSVVQDAMQPTEETDSQSDESVEDEPSAEVSAEASDELDEANDETFDDVPFNKHPRFKKLIEERNAFKEDAEQYGKITGFLDINNVSADEAAQGLQIMALMKGDPVEALAALKPYVQQLSEAAGYVMPDDIQNKVNDGFLDEDAGRELAKTRADVQRERQMRTDLEQRNEQQQFAANTTTMAGAVTDWETKTRQSDPDYELKQAEIDDRVRVLVSQRGRPNTPDMALSMAKEAYDGVNERYAGRFTNKRGIKPASGGKISGTPTPEPASLMEAVQQALSS